MTKLMGVLLSIFMSATGFASPANFSGKWSGKGTYILNGDITQCTQFDMVFVGTTDRFQFVSGSRSCDKHSESFYPVTLQARDGLIYFNGQHVGEYTDSTMDVRYRMPDGNSFRNWRMHMRREGRHLMYEESRTMDGESTPMISFAGMMIIAQ